MADIVEDFSIISWPGLLLRGIASLLFGIAAVFWPAITLIILDFLLGAYFIVSGIINMVDGINGRRNPGFWWLSLVLGAIELIAGVYLVRNPGIAIATFILVIGFVLLIRGILEIIVALERTLPASFKTITIIGGLLSIVAGVAVFLYPGASTLAFVWVLGVYALLMGVVLVAEALDLKSEQESLLIEE